MVKPTSASARRYSSAAAWVCYIVMISSVVRLGVAGSFWRTAGVPQAVVCRSDRARNPNMLNERKQLTKWRRDVLFSSFAADTDVEMAMWSDNCLREMAGEAELGSFSPFLLLRCWFGTDDLKTPQANSTLIPPSPEAQAMLVSEYSDLVSAAMDGQYDLDKWETHAEGLIAKCLLLGPVGEAVQACGGAGGLPMTKKREELARELSRKCHSSFSSELHAIHKAYIARPLLISPHFKDRMLGMSILKNANSAVAGVLPDFLLKDLRVEQVGRKRFNHRRQRKDTTK